MLCAGLALTAAACDSVYHYIVYPPVRVEYALVPDEVLTAKTGDARFKISADKQTVSYDAKDYKIEIKYLTDYHLNTSEFPDQSQSGQYSTNPFTYGNWVDPDLGYVPNRFTVFKVTIYNYAASKINFDPEAAMIRTDKGENLPAFGREEKNSRNQSLEAYFKRRKGTSGIDDDVFESRMGIIRRTVHYLGKPVFRGDVRDGLVVFEPLSDEVEVLKLTVKDFILGYDENNQPSEFSTLEFFFKRVEFTPPVNGAAKNGAAAAKAPIVAKLDENARPSGELNIAILSTNVSAVESVMRPLKEYFDQTTDFSVKFSSTTLQDEELKKANVAIIVADEGRVSFTEANEVAAANFIKRGGFIVVDERSSSSTSENWQAISNFIDNVTANLGSGVNNSRVPSDHLIYNVWKRFSELPPIDETLLNVEGREARTYLMGITYKDRLVAVLSNRGYSIAWGEFGPVELRQGKDFTRQRELLANILYYARETGKNVK
jgi:hypothetical protein